ncbi:bifunctional DNA primase/polymerase [Streptomyces sp900105245]|uniref:Bifunctional DNA primase/polymerase n=1 Tax=Streptomyces sp. 900105245 TaxID=3154379 RepID=A0ABV1UM38_9ACTN
MVAGWCAAQGWAVHPLAPGRKTPISNCTYCREKRHPVQTCSCLLAGHPCHGFYAATTNANRIRAWWSRIPGAGVGVACGPSNLVVIDVDAHAAILPERSRLLPGIPIPDAIDLTGLASGFDTLALLAAYRGQVNPVSDTNTLRVRTPSGGLHIWYRNPYPEIRLRCSTGSGSRVALAWQVDVRADGGYIVAPATRTKKGSYVAVGGVRMPAVLPEWLHAELIRTGHVLSPTPACPSKNTVVRIRRSNNQADSNRVIDSLIKAVEECAAVSEGFSFTEKLNRAAYAAGGLVAAGSLEESIIRDRIIEVANAARPWQNSRNAQIIDNGMAAGATRPFHPKGRP